MNNAIQIWPNTHFQNITDYDSLRLTLNIIVNDIQYKMLKKCDGLSIIKMDDDTPEHFDFTDKDEMVFFRWFNDYVDTVEKSRIDFPIREDRSDFFQ